MIIDPADLDAAHSYKLLIGSILPRPIAWVSTRSTDGVDNLAPVSFFPSRAAHYRCGVGEDGEPTRKGGW